MTTRHRPIVLVLIDWFDPAYKAGGPIRSCVNFVNHLHPFCHLRVITSDHDLGSSQPLSGISRGQWMDYQGKAFVWYATRVQRNSFRIATLVHSVKADLVYLNGLYSLLFTLLPIVLKATRLISGTLLLAPRGMLKKSALSFKAQKKQLFLRAFQLFGLQKHVLFQATDEQEQKDILAIFPNAKVVLLPNLSGPMGTPLRPVQKQKGYLSIFFLGRIHPIKNLLLVIQAMTAVKGNIDFTIIGPLEDESYWKECEQQIGQMDEGKRVHYKGELHHDLLMNEIGQHHMLVLPSQGENFGHSIFESLALGRPVLISDQTPWKQLQQANAGWDLPLSGKELFTHALQKATDWDQQEFDAFSLGAWMLAQRHVQADQVKNEYLKLVNGYVHTGH